MDIQLPQILFQAVNFSVVMGALTLLLYKPLLKLFEERAQRIEEGQKAAAEAIEQQEKIEAIKAKTKQELEKESAELLQKATKEASAQKVILIDEAQAQAERALAEAKEKWAVEKSQLLASTHEGLVAAVVAATKKVIGVTPAKQQEKMIDDELTAVISKL